MKVLVNVLCFLELQAVDQHGPRYNLQAMYLLDKANACGPDNAIAQVAIEASSRSSGQQVGRRIPVKRFGVKDMARRAALVARTTAIASVVRVAHAFSTEVAEPVPYSDYYGGYARGFKSARIPAMLTESETGFWTILFTTLLIAFFGLLILYNRRAILSAMSAVERVCQLHHAYDQRMFPRRGKCR